MVFQIEQGLFLLNFTDNHAILGVPIDAEIKDIRKRYLKIARTLHPDSSVAEGVEERLQASQLLSKLVNPAWEQLSQERERTEYLVMLKLKGQYAAQHQSELNIQSALAKQLLTANDPDHAYHTSLKELAEKQYEHLSQTLNITGQISELNLVYLMRKDSKGTLQIAEPKKPVATGSSTTAEPAKSEIKPQPAPSPEPKRESVAEQYYRRAEGYMAKNNFAQAILELRDALQIEPRNNRCHSLMGMIYLRQNQGTMAKIHFNKALEIDPQDAMALEGKQKLEKGEQAGKTPTKPKSASQKADPKNQGGGLFGLFGGKKK